MGTTALRGRKKWQDESGTRAQTAEGNFYVVFQQEFEYTKFEIIKKPKDFRDIYNHVTLKPEVLNNIYSPNEQWIHGIIPDYAICNNDTGKTLYVEVKRQDGWVENKPRSAGRGNAHERSSKFFTPGLLKTLREKSMIDNKALPFWVVFQGDIARDPKRVREITFWYAEYDQHFFLWHNSSNKKSIINHFNKYLRQLLE